LLEKIQDLLYGDWRLWDFGTFLKGIEQWTLSLFNEEIHIHRNIGFDEFF